MKRKQAYYDHYYYKVTGDLAMFTDPISKGMGEYVSYGFPTHQALVGLSSSIYWKPAILHRIDRVKIMKPMQFSVINVKNLKWSKPVDQCGIFTYTYLKDVEYYVEGHIELNEENTDVEEKNEVSLRKHYEIMLSSIRRGGRRPVFLGTKECVCFVDLISEKDFNEAKQEFEEAKSFYSNHPDIPFLRMFYGFDYNRNGTVKARHFCNGVIQKGMVDYNECQKNFCA